MKYLYSVGVIVCFFISGCARYSVHISGAKTTIEPAGYKKQGALPLVIDGIYYFDARTCNFLFFNTSAIMMCNSPSEADIKSALINSNIFSDVKVRSFRKMSAVSSDAVHMLITVRSRNQEWGIGDIVKWTLNFPSLCLLIPVLSYTHFFEVQLDATVKFPDGTIRSYNSGSNGKAVYTLAGNVGGSKYKALQELTGAVSKRTVDGLIRQIANEQALRQLAGDNNNE